MQLLWKSWADGKNEAGVERRNGGKFRGTEVAAINIQQCRGTHRTVQTQTTPVTVANV